MNLKNDVLTYKEAAQLLSGSRKEHWNAGWPRVVFLMSASHSVAHGPASAFFVLNCSDGLSSEQLNRYD